jgi:hypothetical protein
LGLVINEAGGIFVFVQRLERMFADAGHIEND